MNFIFAFFLLANAATWPTGPAADLRFEQSDFMKTTIDSFPSALSSDASSDGAYGPFNKLYDQGKSREWFIESQRFAFDVIGAGLAFQRKDLIDKGIHILDWGFAHQNPDGSFYCPDRFHSTAFFLEAAARTALLLQASVFTKDYEAWVSRVKPKLLSAARWMTDPINETPGLKDDEIYTHRFYLNADAIGFVGLLNNDQALIRRSTDYIRMGIAKQNPAGFNPEKNGYDTSYHAVGILFAIRYFSIMSDAGTKAELGVMINKGLAWLQGRIGTDGSVDQNGNTRTGAGQEVGRDKKTKTMSYGSAAQAFSYWGQITQNSTDNELAIKLYDYGRLHRH